MTDHTIFNNIAQNTWVYDVDYFDGKWLALILIVTGTGTYTYTTQLYYSETLGNVYSGGQYVQVASGSSNSAYFTPQALTCGNGYIIAWGFSIASSGQSRMLDVYSTSSLTGTFSNIPFSKFWGMEYYTSYPIFSTVLFTSRPQRSKAQIHMLFMVLILTTLTQKSCLPAALPT